MSEYKPSLPRLAYETLKDLGRDIRNIFHAANQPIKFRQSKPDLPLERPRRRQRPPGFYLEMELHNLKESVDNVIDYSIDFIKGAIKDVGKVAIFPYIIPSLHRFDRVDAFNTWRDEKFVQRGSTTSGWHTVFPYHVAVKRPDARQQGSLAGTVAGLGLIAAQVSAYTALWATGLPAALVVATPIVTNVLSGLYEKSQTVKANLIQTHTPQPC
tara:strand:+ start:1928 stop:2566 length:639 start_codon:yes stop_codon:yes gene_type:complete